MATKAPESGDSGIFLKLNKLGKGRGKSSEQPEKPEKPERKSVKETLEAALGQALKIVRQTREDVKHLGIIGTESESLEESEAGEFMEGETDKTHAPIRSLVRKIRRFLQEVEEHSKKNDIQILPWLEKIKALQGNVESTSSGFVSAMVTKGEDTFELIPGQSVPEALPIDPEIQHITDKLKAALSLIENALLGRD